MVSVITSMEVAPGKMQEAQSLQPLTPGPGQGRRLLIICPYDSLAAWGAHMEKVAKDHERNAFMRETFEEKQLFVANTATRTVYTPI